MIPDNMHNLSKNASMLFLFLPVTWFWVFSEQFNHKSWLLFLVIGYAIVGFFLFKKSNKAITLQIVLITNVFIVMQGVIFGSISIFFTVGNIDSTGEEVKYVLALALAFIFGFLFGKSRKKNWGRAEYPNVILVEKGVYYLLLGRSFSEIFWSQKSGMNFGRMMLILAPLVLLTNSWLQEADSQGKAWFFMGSAILVSWMCGFSVCLGCYPILVSRYYFNRGVTLYVHPCQK